MFDIHSLLPNEKEVAQQGTKRTEFSKIWSDALRKGANAEVAHLLQEEGLSANFQVNALKTGPLKYLLLKDEYPRRFIHQQIAAQQLIENGAELTVSDHRRMIPADYALLSNNKEAGSFVIIETLRHQKRKGRSYTPNVESFFAIETDMRTRQRRFANIYSCCRMVARKLEHLKEAGDPDFADLTQSDIRKWEDMAHLKMASMPLPSPELIRSRKHRAFVRETPVSHYPDFKDMPEDKRPQYGRMLEVAQENVGLEEFRAARDPNLRVAGLRVG